MGASWYIQDPRWLVYWISSLWDCTVPILTLGVQYLKEKVEKLTFSSLRGRHANKKAELSTSRLIRSEDSVHMKKFVNRGTQVGAIKTTDERVGRPARGLPLHCHTQCQSQTPPSIHLSFSSEQNSLKCCTIEATDSYFGCNLSFEHVETQLIHPLLARSRFVINATSPFIHFLSQHPTSQSPFRRPCVYRRLQLITPPRQVSWYNNSRQPFRRRV